MYLVKCKCGCWYTLQEECLAHPLRGERRNCPNCGDEHPTIQAMVKTGLDITHIPDTASIEVKFDLPPFPNQ